MDKNSSDYIKELENRNKELLKEISKLKSKPQGKIGYVILCAGLILFSLSIDYSNSMAAFLSLALIFWGVLFLYIRPSSYIRQEILYSTLSDINKYGQIYDSLGYEATPYFFSPSTLSDFTNVILIVPKEKNYSINDESIMSLNQDKMNSDFIKFTPMGLGLSSLIEQEAKINFSTINLEHLFSLLERILIEDLEIIKKLEVKIGDNTIQVKTIDSILSRGVDENFNVKTKHNIFDYLSSAIACSIAKSSHRPVIIESVCKEQNGNITISEFKII